MGYIVEKLDESHFYADISKLTGEIATVYIALSDIESVFMETEHLVTV